MKTTITTLLTVLILIGNKCQLDAQTLNVSPETKLITFEQVLQLDTMKTTTMYNRFKEWYFTKFNQPAESIKGDIRPTLVKATFMDKYTMVLGLKDNFFHDMTIKMKDGAMKITIDNIYSLPDGPGKKSFPIEKDGLKPNGTMKDSKRNKEIDENLNSIVQGLRSFLEKGSDF